MKIRFCENSPKGKGKLAKRIAAEFPAVDVKVSGCQKQCRQCVTSCFCIIDKKQVINGADWEEIYTQLIVHLTELPK
jgi:uncharacterized protein YuzB (UPF0349 family)